MADKKSPQQPPPKPPERPTKPPDAPRIVKEAEERPPTVTITRPLRIHRED